MKSRILLPLVGLVSAILLTAAVVFRPFPTTITHENAAKIEVGMSYPQVVAILGESRDEVEGTELSGLHDLIRLSGVASAGWRGESTHVRIAFASGRVAELKVFDTEFPSTRAYLLWRVRRSVGLSPSDEED